MMSIFIEGFYFETEIEKIGSLWDIEHHEVTMGLSRCKIRLNKGHNCRNHLFEALEALVPVS